MKVVRIYSILLVLSFVTSCGQESSDTPDQQQSNSSEAGIFEDFKYPEKYARMVEKAEGGNREAIARLVSYYSNFPHTDLRNLEYWSSKAASFEGPAIYTNLIVALASHNRCERAWDILEENFTNLAEFPFYSSAGSIELIDKRCQRPKQ